MTARQTTAKEALRERVEQLTEEQAEEWLARMDELEGPALADELRSLWLALPAEDRARIPTGAVDEVVYGSTSGAR